MCKLLVGSGVALVFGSLLGVFVVFTTLFTFNCDAEFGRLPMGCCMYAFLLGCVLLMVGGAGKGL